MNISELCIRRPVMTVLLSIATVIAGAVAYINIPVAALPSFNSPVISVSGSLPGASPGNGCQMGLGRWRDTGPTGAGLSLWLGSLVAGLLLLGAKDRTDG